MEAEDDRLQGHVDELLGRPLDLQQAAIGHGDGVSHGLFEADVVAWLPGRPGGDVGGAGWVLAGVTDVVMG